MNNVRPLKGSVLSGVTNDDRPQSQLGPQPQHALQQMFVDQRYPPADSNFQFAHKNVPLPPVNSANIAYGDVRNASPQMPSNNMFVAPATNMQYEPTPAFHAKPFVFNHMPERPVEAEVLRRTPKNPFLRQEPKFLRNKMEDPATYVKQQEFERLLQQVENILLSRSKYLLILTQNYGLRS